MLFQNHLTDMKRSKVQCKIFVEEYISASFLLWCSMWLQLFLSHQQVHVYIQIQTIACLYTNTNDEIIERFECRHDLSQVFIFWLLLSWTKQTLFKMSKFVKLSSSVWLEKFAFRKEHWFLERVFLLVHWLKPWINQALEFQITVKLIIHCLTWMCYPLMWIAMSQLMSQISRCHKIKWHKSPFT